MINIPMNFSQKVALILTFALAGFSLLYVPFQYSDSLQNSNIGYYFLFVPPTLVEAIGNLEEGSKPHVMAQLNIAYSTCAAVIFTGLSIVNALGLFSRKRTAKASNSII